MSRAPQLVIRDHGLSVFRRRGLMPALLRRSHRHDGNGPLNEALWCGDVERLLPAAVHGLSNHVSLVELHVSEVVWLREQLGNSGAQLLADVSAYVDSVDDVAVVPPEVRHVTFAAQWDPVFIAVAEPRSNVDAMQHRSDCILDACAEAGLSANALLLGSVSSPFRKEPDMVGAADEALRLVRGGCSIVTVDDTMAAHDTRAMDVVLKTAIANGLNASQELAVAMRPGPALGALVDRIMGLGVRQFCTATVASQSDFCAPLLSSDKLLYAASKHLGGVDDAALEELNRVGDAAGALARKCSSSQKANRGLK